VSVTDRVGGGRAVDRAVDAVETHVLADPFRTAALLGVAALTFSYTSVLYHVTDVVGGSTSLAVLVLAALVAGVAMAEALTVRQASALAVVLLIGGLLGYLWIIPDSQFALLTFERILGDTLALLTGLSVLRLTEAGIWAMAVAPGPVFLSWYLAVRRQYALSVAVGGIALGLFVLTGDADILTTLAGVVAATAAVGFGTLELRGSSTAQLDTLAMVLAVMIVLAASVSIVPGGATQPLLPDRGNPTMEGSLVSAGDTVQVVGSIRLSPKVRFTVEADEGEYWQTASFDRYTGNGWVRTGQLRTYDGDQPGPPGDARRMQQRVTAKTPLDAMPAAWKPVTVRGQLSRATQVTDQGGIRPGTTIRDEESYTVVSEVPEYTNAELERAGTDYPTRIEGAYLQLPDSTSDRLEEVAAEVTADADTPYQKAVAVERYLESEKSYSLSVQRPDGDVAEAFLFDMDAGYCVYYATTMTVMLRSQGVPARFVVGYTAGESVEGDSYVVRGLDSHAWVQVYFPDVGWVNFDPTPASERQQAESAELTQARRSGVEGVDTEATEAASGGSASNQPDDEQQFNGTGAVANTPDPESLLTGNNTSTPNASSATAQPGERLPGGLNEGPAESDGMELPDLPSPRNIGLGLVVIVGLAAGARRTGAARRVTREMWLRYQRRSESPGGDVEEAYRRLEYYLAKQYRPRRSGETVRTYLDEISWSRFDQRAYEVADLYEKARYGDGVTREEADRAVRTVSAMARESTPVLRRFTG
jgi:transglutaminase-like putative cysteine protease